MRKTALAVALGAVFVAPAAQAQIVFGNDQIGTVQIYGRLYPQIQYGRATGATQAGTTVSTLVATSGTLGTSGTDTGGRFAIQTQNSRLGFRGERNLGGGLKGIWQIEQTVNFEDPENADNDAIFATRNSFLGLRGGFGTVKLGNMDTIYKEYGDTFDMFGIKSGNFVSGSNMLSQIGIGRSSTARFHERAANSIQYETPQFGGFTFGAQYSPDEKMNDPGATVTGGTDRVNRRLFSTGVKWESKTAYASIHHERHYDYFGGSRNVNVSGLRNINTTTNVLNEPDVKSLDTATRLSAWYRLGIHTISGDIARMKWEETGQTTGVARFKNYRHTNWAVGLNSNWSFKWRTAIQYVRGGKGTCELTVGACDSTGYNSWMLNAGVGYYFDRSTVLYAIAGKLNNGPSARYDNASNFDPSRGADITQAAVGLSYSF